MNTLLTALIEWFVERPWAFLTELVLWIKVFVTQTIPAAMWRLVPEGIADYFDSIDLQLLDSLLDIAGWWIPFWELVAVYFIAYTLCATIRFFRFVIGWIPFLEG